MNLYLIERTDDLQDYDEYDSAVVAAPDYSYAATMDPSNGQTITEWPCRSWVSRPEKVSVKYLGVSAVHTEPTIVCSSYNAG